jgi:hypothetical protein
MKRFAYWVLVGLAVVGQHAAAAQAADTRISVLSGAQVIQILDDTVEWYRALGTQQQNATQPSDLLILFANRQTADKVVSLAFDIARANAELLSSEASAQAAAGGTTASQTLSQQQTQLDAARQSIQQEMGAERQKLAAGGKGKSDLEAKLSELQGELAMVDARRNLLDTMTEFVSGSDPKAANANALKAQIDAIAATVPAAGVNVTTTAAPAATVGANPAPGASLNVAAGDAAQTRVGIWDLATEVLRQHRKIGTIAAIDQRTAALAATFHGISAAPLARLQAYSGRGDALASQADHASGAGLKDLRNQFDTLAWLFKQTSEVLLPLGKEQVLLKQYRHNLASWRDSVQKQYYEAWTALGLRVGIVAGILAVVFALGEVWRRAVLRYAHDSHRRYQLLLVRTIVVWTVMLAVIGLSFVTQISTFATFAGLLTAGLAVAMQSVLVSVVGYFFLIGKYGIRVGDRIQIGTVVGEVLDIGLVRLHLRELNQQGPLGATGRVVAFANLIVFQASGGLFKQIADADLTWHEATVPLPTVSDYAALKAKLLAAMGVAVGAHGAETAPQVQMRLTGGGRMEALIRYPVTFKDAAQTDERVAQAVVGTLAEPAVASSGQPSTVSVPPL